MTNSTTSDVRFVGVPEFGRQFAIGRTKAYALVSAGVVRSCRIGERIVIPIAELDRFAAELLATAS